MSNISIPKGVGGGTPSDVDFKWRGWLNEGKNPNPEIPALKKKSLDQKLTPKKSHTEFPESIKWYMYIV